MEMGLLTHDGEILIRRIIPRSGKGRIYLNGGLVPLGLLQQLGEVLVDIHGQHEHQSLLKHELQLELLDGYGKLLPLRDAYRQHYLKLNALSREQQELQALESDRVRLSDLLQFQYQEIRSAHLKPGEEEQLVQERQLLSHSERLTALSSEGYEALYGAEGSILSRLSRVGSLLGELGQIDPRWGEAKELSASAEAGLREVAERLRAYRDRIEYDPKRLEEIEDRLHLIGRLKKKYGATVEEVLRTLEKVEEELKGLSNREGRLQIIEEQRREEQKKAHELARKLTHERGRAARSLAKGMERELKPLRMGRTTFEVRIKPINGEGGPASPTGGLGPMGADVAEFLIAPNPGEEARLLTRIASGGELSRIMLALKAILADVDRVPTLIFDEVDAGIGGAVAEVVGQRLKAISRHRQVFCITHLPQIAASATTHVAIEKRVEGGRTVTRASQLSDKERIEEVARMLGGRKITPTTLKHAQEMLGL